MKQHWLGTSIAEISKRRGKYSHDIFLIKDLTRTTLDGWAQDDVEWVTKQIKKQFTVSKIVSSWISEYT